MPCANRNCLFLVNPACLYRFVPLFSFPKCSTGNNNPLYENRFIRNNPGLLLTSLRFLREEPGLLDFENKRTLLWTLLALPYNHGRLETIHLPRGPGEALGTILRWMQLHGGQYGKHRLASFLRCGTGQELSS